MLSILKRWLGWEADTEFYGEPRLRSRPSSATAHLFAKAPPPSSVPPPRKAGAAGQRSLGARSPGPKPAPGARAAGTSPMAAKRQANPQRPAAKPLPGTRPPGAKPPQGMPAAAARRTAANKPSPARGVQGRKAVPTLSLDEPPNPQFDPYNTGKFDRSASWERISKTQR